MNGSFSAFPRGTGGAALLLLRLSIGVLLLVEGDAVRSLALFPRMGLFVLATALAAGFLTRSAAVLSALVIALVYGGSDNARFMVLELFAVVAIAVAMAGAGAYSIDALLFGRRVIDLNK